VRQGLDPATSQRFIAFAAGLVAPAFDTVGWDKSADDSDNRKLLRTTLVGLLANYCFKDDKVAAEAKKRFDAFIQAPTDAAALAADIRAAVFSITMQSCGSDDIFDKLVEAHNAVTDGAVRQHIYAALGKSPTKALRKRALELVLTETVRSQDMVYIPMSMALSGVEASQQVFDWVKDSYDRVYARLGQTSMMLFQHIVRISGFGFVTEEKAQEVEALWKSKAVCDKIQKSLDQTLEGIRSSAKFVERLRASPVAKPEAWS
jgi:aminopeptidase N